MSAGIGVGATVPPGHLALHARTHTAPAFPPMELTREQQMQQQQQEQTLSPLAISSELIQRRLQENEWKRRTIAANRMQSAAAGAGHSRTRSLQQQQGAGTSFRGDLFGPSGPQLAGGGSAGSERELQLLADEYIALLLQNEEFVSELRRDPEFMQILAQGVHI